MSLVIRKNRAKILEVTGISVLTKIAVTKYYLIIGGRLWYAGSRGDNLNSICGTEFIHQTVSWTLDAGVPFTLRDVAATFVKGTTKTRTYIKEWESQEWKSRKPPKPPRLEIKIAS